MLVSLLLILLLTVGGLSLTYFIAEDEPFLWRVGAGNIIGSAVFGLVCFLLACFFGFSNFIVLIAYLISLSPLLVFIEKPKRLKFKNDWQKAKGKMEGANFTKFLRFAYYIFFIGVFYFFFERAVIENANGIFTGGSQNYGDLPFHLGAIFSFSEGNNFPPENPSYAFAKFSYPFIADLITASFVKLGAGVREAMLWQNVTLAFSLLVVLERFVFKLTNNRLAGKIAPALLFFSGGLGFVWFFKDYWQSAQGFFDFLSSLPIDYTIRNGDKGEIFRWGNSLVVLFVTQRSLLLGMPLTVIVLQKIWEIFIGGEETETKNRENKRIEIVRRPLSDMQCFYVGLLAGTLPLIHVHSLAVLFVITAFLFFFKFDEWRKWLAFGIGTAIVAVPELIWVMTGTATRLTEFIAWNFGWDKRTDNFFWFWFKNTGIFIPVLLFGIYLVWERAQTGDETAERNEAATEETEIIEREKPARRKSDFLFPVPHPLSLLLFFLPFPRLFFVSNIVKLAPWEWDNIKVLIYWFIGSLPVVAFALAWLWTADELVINYLKNKRATGKSNDSSTKYTKETKNKTKSKGLSLLFSCLSYVSRAIRLIFRHTLKIVAVGCFIILIFAGALDVWRTISGETNYNVFSRDSVAVAKEIKQKTAPNALFFNAPTLSSAIVLSGRRSLMRYSGHLSSYGIDYYGREAEVKKIYAGDASAEILLNKYNVEYVLISPEEKSDMTVNEEFFRRFPIVAQAGDYRVYQVKK